MEVEEPVAHLVAAAQALEQVVVIMVAMVNLVNGVKFWLVCVFMLIILRTSLIQYCDGDGEEVHLVGGGADTLHHTPRCQHLGGREEGRVEGRRGGGRGEEGWEERGGERFTCPGERGEEVTGRKDCGSRGSEEERGDHLREGGGGGEEKVEEEEPTHVISSVTVQPVTSRPWLWV